MNNQNLNSIINNKKAVENAQPTAKTPDSRIAPLSPLYSGYSNVWFVDWTHPDAKHFKPFPNKLK